MQDFKECLEDLEQQVADVTDQLQQLAGCTADAVSFEVRLQRQQMHMQGCVAGG